MASDEDLKAEIERLRAENEALKKPTRGQMSLKVSEKGGLSVYGLGRFPVTLYREQWEKLLGMADEIRNFIRENDSALKKKEQIVRYAALAVFLDLLVAFFVAFAAAFFAAHLWRILSAAASRWAAENFRRIVLGAGAAAVNAVEDFNAFLAAFFFRAGAPFFTVPEDACKLTASFALPKAAFAS